jgi:hypothetical protein
MIFVASIYNAKTRFLVVDIETTKQDNSFIFDIGFGIYSRAEKMVKTWSFIVKENESKIPFYADRLKRYAEYMESDTYFVERFRKIMATLSQVVNEYQPQYLTAYNLGFDFGTIAKVCKRMNIVNPLENLVAFDMWQGACETIGQQKGYKRFTSDNGFFSEKGNRQSGAEIMYRYLKADPHFKEEHTGLGDILIEVEILDRILRQKKPLSMKWGNRSQAWRLVQG